MGKIIPYIMEKNMFETTSQRKSSFCPHDEWQNESKWSGGFNPWPKSSKASILATISKRGLLENTPEKCTGYGTMFHLNKKHEETQ